MHRYIAIVYLLLFSFNVPGIYGQDGDEVVIKTDVLTENVYMLTGQGGNIGVVINEDHVLVIDSQFDELYDKIMEKIAMLTDKPVRYLLNTHWHRDHVGGNARFSNDGAAIIAHENVKVRLVTGGKVDFFGTEVTPQPNEVLPELTFSEGATIDFGDETVTIIYVPNAHTDGDAMVHLPENNAIHMGDAYFSQMFPFVDLGSGGTIEGMIAAHELALTLCDDQTKVIPGHGPLSDANELREQTDMLKKVLDYVKKGKESGVSLKEIIDGSAEFMKSYDEAYGGSFIKAKDLLSFVYNSP